MVLDNRRILGDLQVLRACRRRNRAPSFRTAIIVMLCTLSCTVIIAEHVFYVVHVVQVA